MREILYLFAKEHSHIGYRQGMHEVASYVWLVLQLDQKQTTTSSSLEDNQQQQLLWGRPAAYRLLTSILVPLRQAFDVKVAGSNSHPLDDMAQAILANIQLHHRYQQLQKQNNSHNGISLSPFLQQLSVPPQLYCTKQIRLLFSREVVGAHNIIALWDVFVELVSEGWEWMAVMETTAASRILLFRDQLLTPRQNDGTVVGVGGDNDSQQNTSSLAAVQHHAMDLLMNMPPLTVRLVIFVSFLERNKRCNCLRFQIYLTFLLATRRIFNFCTTRTLNHWFIK